MIRETSLKMRLYLTAAIILIVGMGSAAVIHLTAEDSNDNAIGYIIIDGKSYPVQPEHSKMYRHNLELYGGKWNVFADQFIRWFTGLWQGKSLATTIACLTAFTSLIVFLIAKRLPSSSKS